MNAERVFQVCVSVMAVLATFMLGTSQENNILPLVAFFAAIVALVFTDILGWFSLHPILAGVFGLLAGVFAFFQMQGGGLEGQFVSVANLLIHLQIVLLFQQKSIRIYWQLITLSLLQVVVASALNLFVFFGPLLILYSAVALAGLIAFFIYRETQIPAGNTTKRQRIRKPSIIQIESFTSSNVHVPRLRLMKTSAWRSFFLLAVSTFFVSSAVFLLMPRFGDGVWRPTNSGMAATGFSGNVDLDDVGSLLENPTMVMRVSFIDQTTKGPYLLSGNPYLRGSVSDEYLRGRWSRGRELRQDELRPLPRPQRIFSAVRQQVALEARKNNIVFSLAPVCALEDTTESMRLAESTNEVRLMPRRNEDSASYSLGTLSLHNGQQSDFSPILRELSPNRERRREIWVQREMPELSAIAAEIVRDIPPEQTLARARKLSEFFRDSDQGFQYSLDPSSERKRGVDPVVDFVTNHRQGHCQYFASALALMLRSQGIPSRVVVGYLGNSYNDFGNYYEIREMDAHAWVEAAIPADQIPADEVLPHEGISGAAWVRLDPTPLAALDLEKVTVSPWRAKIGDSLDYMQLLWSEYVLGLNEKRQRRRIYEPIQEFFRGIARSLFSPERWTARWETLMSRFQSGLFTRENFRDSTIAATVLLTIAYFLKQLWQFSRSFWGSWKKNYRSRAPQVEFYVQFERLLKQHGLRREAEQTAREFAITAKKRLERLSAEPALAGVPETTVDLFYRVRFGREQLSGAENQQLSEGFKRLKDFLSTPKRKTLK